MRHHQLGNCSHHGTEILQRVSPKLFIFDLYIGMPHRPGGLLLPQTEHLQWRTCTASTELHRIYEHIASKTTSNDQIMLNRDAVGTFAVGISPQMTVIFNRTSVTTSNFHTRLRCHSVKDSKLQQNVRYDVKLENLRMSMKTIAGAASAFTSFTRECTSKHPRCHVFLPVFPIPSSSNAPVYNDAKLHYHTRHAFFRTGD